jgi:hypothetical protein
MGAEIHPSSCLALHIKRTLLLTGNKHSTFLTNVNRISNLSFEENAANLSRYAAKNGYFPLK